MTNEEIIFEILEGDRKAREGLGNTYIPAMMENITQIRGLIKHFITISGGIIGLTIPILGRTGLVKNGILLRGGLCELLVLIIFGYYHLTNILQKENKYLAESFVKYNDYWDKISRVRDDWFSDLQNTEKFETYRGVAKEIAGKINKQSKEGEEIKKSDHDLNIMFAAFFVALALITASMLPF